MENIILLFGIWTIILTVGIIAGSLSVIIVNKLADKTDKNEVESAE